MNFSKTSVCHSAIETDFLQENGKTLVKSGSDFVSMSKISVVFDDNANKIRIETQKIDIDGSIEENNEIKTVTKDFLGGFYNRL